MITGLEHTAIACSDPKGLSSWYLKYLGFSALLDTGKTIYIQSANGVVLEFVFAETHHRRRWFETRVCGILHSRQTI